MRNLCRIGLALVLVGPVSACAEGVDETDAGLLSAGGPKSDAIEDTETGGAGTGGGESGTTAHDETGGGSGGVPPSCGDGVVQGVEVCDDGNADDTDACTHTCHEARCGDGFVREGVELCDDGNTNDTDDCTNSCTLASCGDGIVAPGEECDDGNLSDADDCLSTCIEARCGDGYTHDDDEACDDGNPDNHDACRNNCEFAACGDGFVHAGVEECDDGNGSDADACLSSCQEAECGDGYVEAGAEECDDGNGADNDGCSALCVDETVEYSDTISTGIVYTFDPECFVWNEFRAEILDHTGYTRINIAGTYDPSGITCTGSEAAQLCAALATGAFASLDCDGNHWNVSNCGGGIEVSVGDYGCQCEDPGYAVRPCIGSHQWGGIDGPTCGATTQTLEVTCGW